MAKRAGPSTPPTKTAERPAVLICRARSARQGGQNMSARFRGTLKSLLAALGSPDPTRRQKAHQKIRNTLAVNHGLLHRGKRPTGGCAADPNRNLFLIFLASSRGRVGGFLPISIC
jgi:hypothetical protein